MAEKRLPSTKTVFNYSARLHKIWDVQLCMDFQKEKGIEVLSFKMLLNDAINNLRDLNISMVYETCRNEVNQIISMTYQSYIINDREGLGSGLNLGDPTI